MADKKRKPVKYTGWRGVNQKVNKAEKKTRIFTKKTKEKYEKTVKPVKKAINSYKTVKDVAKHPLQKPELFSQLTHPIRTLKNAFTTYQEGKATKRNTLGYLLHPIQTLKSATKEFIGFKYIKHPILTAYRVIRGIIRANAADEVKEARKVKEQNDKTLQMLREARAESRVENTTKKSYSTYKKIKRIEDKTEGEISSSVKDIMEEQQYKAVIDRLKARIDYRLSTAGKRGWGDNDDKTDKALAQQKYAVNNSYIKASQLIDMSVKKNGYRATAIALKNWEGRFEDEIIRLEAAIYDEEYAEWGSGGRTSYEFKLRELVRALELDKEDFTEGYESFVADFK